MRAASTIRPISSSNPIPAASAAWGNRLVSVSPGIASASSTYSSSVPDSSIMSTRANPDSPSSAYTSSAIAARALADRVVEVRRAHEPRAADFVARLEVVEVLLLGHGLDDRERARRPASSMIDTARSRPATYRSSTTLRSYENAAISAPGTSDGVRANLIPSADPWPAGLTTIGNWRRSSIAGSACAAPSSRKAVSLNA